MSEKKRVKQALKSVWDRVKATRDERAKRYDPYDVLQSADELATLADELRALGTELSALQPMPMGEPLVTGAGGKTGD
jgi:hypothetical protein